MTETPKADAPVLNSSFFDDVASSLCQIDLMIEAVEITFGEQHHYRSDGSRNFELDRAEAILVGSRALILRLTNEIDGQVRRPRGRTISELTLMEASLVTLPMHPGARVTSAKDAAGALRIAAALQRATAQLTQR